MTLEGSCSTAGDGRLPQKWQESDLPPKERLTYEVSLWAHRNNEETELPKPPTCLADQVICLFSVWVNPQTWGSWTANPSQRQEGEDGITWGSQSADDRLTNGLVMFYLDFALLDLVRPPRNFTCIESLRTINFTMCMMEARLRNKKYDTSIISLFFYLSLSDVLRATCKHCWIMLDILFDPLEIVHGSRV